MSVAMLTSLSVNFSAFTASVPPTTGGDRPARPVEQKDEDEKPRFRENALVSAMMAAFQALGIGQTPASTATGPATPPASATSTAPATSTTTVVSGAASVAGTTGTTGTTDTSGAAGTGSATSSTPAPVTLDKAVNEFAHALFGLLRRQGGGEHSEGQHGGEHTHGHEGHGQGGYNGLVQRLEQLAQSLGGATPASSGTPAASGTTASGSVDSTSAAPVSTSSTTTPSTAPVAPPPNPRLERLLTAFTNVLNFLQPATATAATTPASGAPADTPVAPSSVADKLKLFLTTLAQSLNTGEQLSPVGSRVNYTV
jgi:hypothetical protein